jgi:hypothetical protein
VRELLKWGEKRVPCIHVFAPIPGRAQDWLGLMSLVAVFEKNGFLSAEVPNFNPTSSMNF